jgi:hypothetical protein
VNRHGINPIFERPLYSEFVADFDALEHILLPSAHTVLLIAADARGIPSDIVARVAERLLASGLIYVCTWGPDCKRVHDTFDAAHVGDATREPNFHLTSTWHSNEPLEEAIWYFLQCACPPGPEIQTASYLAVTIGSAEWAATATSALSERDTFIARMLNGELESTGNA